MIAINNVTFTYSETAVSGIQDITINISKGDCVLLCGKSGCGKTTITKLINGLIPHFENGVKTGEVLINGENVDDTPLYIVSKTVASVFQNPKSQFFNVEPDSEIVFSLENQGLPLVLVEKKLAETIETLGLSALMHKSMLKMSGGEKQLIAFACAYASGAEIVVLDEPSANLDAGATRSIASVIAKMKAEGRTILIAEHRIAYLKNLINTAVMIEEGKLSAVYSSAEFFSKDDSWRKYYGIRQLSDTYQFTPPCFINKAIDDPLGLEVKNLTLQYDKKTVSTDINFKVGRGEILALVGENGAGKTTLSRCLCGLHKEQSGDILYNGKCLTRKKRRKLAYLVMQDVNHQLFGDSVENECLMGDKGITADKAEQILREFGLQDLRNRHPHSLSGGQKQRLALAAAVLQDKELLILDEPTSGLDYENMCHVAKMLRNLADMGKTLIVITHDTELIESVCTRCIYLKKDGIQEINGI